MKTLSLDKYRGALAGINTLEQAGRVTKIVGLAVEASGRAEAVGVDSAVRHKFVHKFGSEDFVKFFRDITERIF